MILQNPEDIDLDQWLEEGELTELLEIHLDEAKLMVREPSDDWDEFQQEEDEYQTPDKWQRIWQMVFCGGCLERNPN